LRFAGDVIFRINPLALLEVSLPLMIAVALLVLRNRRTLAIWFGRVFPNIRPDAARVFGGWLHGG
jgi:hypothetical protein